MRKPSTCPSARWRWCWPAAAAAGCSNLTDSRAKPAVYFGGKFRIVDFALSNCLNSGIRRIGVITQYKSHSLLRHLQRGWAFLKSEMNEFVDLLPAQQRVDEETLVPRHGRRRLPEPGHPGRLRRRLRGGAGRRPHLQDELRADAGRPRGAWGATCTVGCIEVPRSEASAFGVMAVDEQPTHHRLRREAGRPAARCRASPTAALASMGIYIFNAKLPVRRARARHGRPELQPRLRQGHHPARGARRAAPWPTRSS